MQRKSGKQREGLLRCGGLLLTGLLLAASAACSRRGSAGPNVLLLTLDTTRADHLGAYGYARGATPVLDRLARRGALFTETVTTAPLTLPAHASIMTGTYPARHGARDNGIYVLADAPNRTLAETLGERGYQTAAVVSAFVLERRFGLAQGFDAYEDDPGEMSAGEARLDPERPAASATDAALRLARGTDPRRPLFLWVHYFDAHAPYAPPEPDRTRFQPTREDPQRGYDGEIASMDREIGRLLTGLRRLGRLRHCLVVVVGDHGDGLATLHLEKTHGVFLYRETLHVPLILHDTEGRIPPRVVAGLSRVVDVAPTILGYLGFPGPADGEGDAAGRGAGLSLLARAGGGTAPGAPAHLRALAETLMPYDSFGWSPLFSLRSGRWKLIRAPRPELYDLERDPGEQVNRYGEEPEVARDMEALLDRELDGASRGGEAAPPQSPPPLGPGDRAKLEHLGYVLAPGPPPGLPPAGRFPDKDPKDLIGVQLDLQLVRLALNDGDIDRARRLLGSVLARDPDNIEALVDLGDALYQGGDLEGAIGRYRRATKLGPRSYRNFYKLATLLKAKGDGLRANGPATAAIGPYQQAEAAFRRAVEIFPGDHFSMTNLAGLLLDWVPSPREKEAEAWYLRATRCGPRFPQAHLGLGYVRLRRGHPAQAVAPLETAVALREEPTSVFLLGEAYRLLGRGEEAAQCYRRVLELDPGHAQARRRLREEARGAGRTGG